LQEQQLRFAPAFANQKFINGGQWRSRRGLPSLAEQEFAKILASHRSHAREDNDRAYQERRERSKHYH
jgi:hypothetical protein